MTDAMSPNKPTAPDQNKPAVAPNAPKPDNAASQPAKPVATPTIKS